MARIEDVIARRQKIAEAYNRELAEIAEITRPPLTSEIGRISWFVYPVQLADEFEVADRDRVCEALLRKGIATGRYFAPLHQQPVWQKLPKTSTTGGTEVHEGSATEENVALPRTELVAERVIQLPFFNELTEGQVQEVCKALEHAVQGARRNT